MKVLRLVVVTVFTVLTGLQFVSAESKVSGKMLKEMAKKELASVMGKVYFLEYTVEGAMSCNALIITKDDKTFCLVTNEVTKKMREEIGRTPTLVALKGDFLQKYDTDYLHVKEYKVIVRYPEGENEKK